MPRAVNYLDPKRPGRIEIGSLSPDEDGTVKYYVRDNGLGIPAAYLPKMFVAFQRLHGQIASTDNWGRKRLAYEIARHKEGYYVLQTINGSGELMKELDRRLKVMDQVIRHMVVRVDEEKKVVERTRTKRQSESERRRGEPSGDIRA